MSSNMKPVDWKVEGSVGVISRFFSSFSANVGSEALDAFKQIKAKTGGRVTGLILDLRGESGRAARSGRRLVRPVP
jgi:carboxyl-terminal processing protease